MFLSIPSKVLNTTQPPMTLLHNSVILENQAEEGRLQEVVQL
ncbi:hypothetical protein [Endozoicomonas euniceicola]|uniref:Uncharacterized protein n=1 Tax=Endozoicomonas euniceicola TaxID=1234143 RepID=A0ABY6GMI7_9GAMM|nr:hypothetical protein [Endozoicomonas euniceicola]UYM13930.1 hypothetical protein NX720_13490 [Endozoicomonas euniceicola]